MNAFIERKKFKAKNQKDESDGTKSQQRRGAEGRRSMGKKVKSFELQGG